MFQHFIFISKDRGVDLLDLYNLDVDKVSEAGIGSRERPEKRKWPISGKCKPFWLIAGKGVRRHLRWPLMSDKDKRRGPRALFNGGGRRNLTILHVFMLFRWDSLRENRFPATGEDTQPSSRASPGPVDQFRTVWRSPAKWWKAPTASTDLFSTGFPLVPQNGGIGLRESLYSCKLKGNLQGLITLSESSQKIRIIFSTNERTGRQSKETWPKQCADLTEAGKELKLYCNDSGSPTGGWRNDKSY